MASAPIVVQPLSPPVQEALTHALHKLKHDLSNSLVAAMGELELLVDDVNDPELAERVRETRVMLLRPFQELRRISTALPLSERNTQRWQDVRQQLDARARDLSATIVWQPETLAMITADVTLIPLVSALVCNALDACDVGGTIEVSGDVSSLTVSDDGPGCSDLEGAASGRIKRAGGAHLGLGLAVAAATLATRGGQLTLQTNDPHGLRAVATWPTR